MRRLSLFIVGIGLIVSQARAGTVVGSNFIAVPDPSVPGAQYRFTVYQDEPATDPTSLFVSLSGQVMTAINWNVDEEAVYYLVPNLAVFSVATISSGIFPPLFALNQPHAINVGFGDFYLGINTGQGFAGGHPNRNVFGWAHFVNNQQTGLQVIRQCCHLRERRHHCWNYHRGSSPGAIYLHIGCRWMMAARRHCPPQEVGAPKGRAITGSPDVCHRPEFAKSGGPGAVDHALPGAATHCHSPAGVV